MLLDKLAIKHETDKSSLGHNYVKYYSIFFEALKENPIKLLEIGIDKGGSLRMWQEYFPNSVIHGIDIINCTKYESNQIKTHIVDQSKVSDLRLFIENWKDYFDVIIDDGSHRSMDIILSFSELFPYLKSGGYYIIEDTLWDYKNLEMSKLSTKLIDDVNLNGKIQLCANKNNTVPKHADEMGFTYYERHMDWVFNSCGLCVIKKL